MDAQALADLRAHVEALLRPQGLRERVRPPERTVKQLWVSLPDHCRPPAGGLGVAAEQRSLDVLREVLAGMVADGVLARRTVRRRVFLNTKGKRLAQVDVYRLA